MMTGASRPRKTLGSITYVDKPVTGEELYTTIHETHDGGKTSSNLLHDERTVEVHDIRTASRDFSLVKNGFEFHNLVVPGGIDWRDPAQVKEKYYPVAEKLLRKVTGASRVHIFDTTLRFGRLKAPDSKTESAKRGRPQGSVHVDYHNSAGRQRLKELLPEEFDRLQKTPFAVVQIWRPLKGPVRSSPLGMIDVETVKEEDMTPYDIRRPERVGGNYAVHYNPDHKWYYAEGMTTDEAYVFVCYHSKLDRARFTPHSGFRDLSVGDDAPDRESIELRSYVFWEDEEQLENHQL